jgi:cobalt/nickel transport system permease protein
VFDEPFAQGDSPVHRLDPRVRLASAAFFAVCVALLREPSAAAAALALAAAALAASLPPVSLLARRLAVINVFVLFLWATVPATMPGQTLLAAGPLSFSREGVALAWLVTLKSNAIVMAFLALAATMNAPTMGHAMDRLGAPSKLVFLFLFTYRQVHVIADEWRRMVTVARLRGFVARTGLHGYRTIAHLLAMVLVKSFDRSGRVYQAMVLRGFAGRFGSVARFEAGPRDVIFALLWLAASAAFIMMDLYPEAFGV